MRNISELEMQSVAGGDETATNEMCEVVGDAVGVGVGAAVLAGSGMTAGTAAGSAVIVNRVVDASVTRACSIASQFIVDTVNGWIDEIDDSVTGQVTGY